MSNTILKFEDISKQYRLGLVGTGTISHDLNRWWYRIRGKDDPYLKIGQSNDRATKGDSQYVWALKDINLDVKHGDVLGIIGKNGAGKSTLLKILSKVTSPTTGTIKSKGRIASLLEVGTGFHPELTGRENIYLNGAILGMTKAEIAGKLDEIVDFSGCERYIDTPVKRYSSGMKVRLAFAVAAHLEPEILVVDEVLAVGDAEFQKKAIGKMQDISKSGGRTVLFVSHNMASITEICRTAIVLNNGEISYRGNVAQAIQRYSQSVMNIETETLHENGDKGWIRLFVNDDTEHCSINNTDSFEITADLSLLSDINRVRIVCFMENAEGTKVVFNRHFDFGELDKGIHRIKALFPSLYLLPGVYSLYIKLFAETKNSFQIKHFSERLLIGVTDKTGMFSGKHLATILPPVEWSVSSLETVKMI
jgi:lipopolysaccharide transport system ATP-binding protein